MKPWQVIAVAWARNLEDSALMAWLLADDMGLGKTLTALATMTFQAKAVGATFATDLISASTSEKASDQAMLCQDKNASNPPDPTAPATTSTSHMTSTQAMLSQDNNAPNPSDTAEPATANPEYPAESSKRPTTKHTIPTNPKNDQHEQASEDDDATDATADVSKSRKIRRRERIQQRVSKLAERTHKPKLVIAPSTATGVWKSEVRQHFPHLSVRYFIGRPGVGPYHDRRRTLNPNLDSLLDYLESLPDTPETLATMIITSYSTWQGRSGYLDEESTDTTVQKLTAKLKAARGQEDDDVNLEDAGYSIDAGVSWRPLMVGTFGRVISDEAQKIKNTRSISFQSVKGLDAGIMCLPTATPMINKPSDLHGLLRMIWKLSQLYLFKSKLRYFYHFS